MTRISKKVPYLNRLIAEEYKILYSLQSKVSSQNTPQTPEERFALFLLKWLQKVITPEFLESKFKQLNEKGIFGCYNTEQENNSDYDKQTILNGLIRGFIDASSSKILNKKQLGYITTIILELQNDKSEISQQQYSALLFLEYCCIFSSVIPMKEFTNEQLLIYIRTLKQAIKKSSLLNQAKQEVISQMVHTQPDEQFFRSYLDDYDPSEPVDNLKKTVNFFNDFFRITDICLDYQEWKNTILGINNFEERLWLSLYVRPHQYSDIMLGDNIFGTDKKLSLNCHLNLTKEQQIVSMLYYWYYGLFEGGYANLFFTILHNEPTSREGKAFLRLFAIEEDVKLKHYIQKKYAIYCSQECIVETKQFEGLRSNSEKLETDNDTEYSIDATSIGSDKRFEKPKDFTDKQIDYLVKLLTNQAKLVTMVDQENQQYLSYFLGGRGKKLPEGQFIKWEGSRYILKYFIKQLYIEVSKFGNGRWQTVANNFIVKSRGKYKQFLNSESYSNLNEPDSLNDTDKTHKELIDECINQARTTNSK